jgi:hypothetical protein
MFRLGEFGYLVIWLSGHLVIWSSGYLVIWLFGRRFVNPTNQ